MVMWHRLWVQVFGCDHIRVEIFIFIFIFWCRWGIGMPSLVKYSIKIISDAGLGMAMFSLGWYILLLVYSHDYIKPTN